MRLNKFIARATGLSRRAADKAIADGHIKINGVLAQVGQNLTPDDVVTHSDKVLALPTTTTLLLNKPPGYICSRDGQGNKTIYQLLPESLHGLKPIGRLDKDSSGLLLLTNDGDFAHKLTHPSFQKEKIYEITLRRDLEESERALIQKGVLLDDGVSKIRIKQLGEDPKTWQVRMSEGRNRQIRRTFSELNHTVTRLHRTHFGPFTLEGVKTGKTKLVTTD